MSKIEVDTGALSLYPLLGMGMSLQVYLNIIELYTETFERILNRTKLRPNNAHNVLYNTYRETIYILDDDMYSETSILANVCDFYDTEVYSCLEGEFDKIERDGIIIHSTVPSALVSIIESVESDMLSIKATLNHIIEYDFEYSLAQVTDTYGIDSLEKGIIYSAYTDPLDYESDEIILKDKDILKGIDVYIKRLDLQSKICEMIKTICLNYIDD